MHKVILIPMVATSVLLGCQEQPKLQQVSAAQQQAQVVWVGDYQGTTPCLGCLSRCDDCPGMLVNLTLHADKTYVLQRLSLSGHNEIETLKGKISVQNQHQIQLMDLEQRNLMVFDAHNKVLEIREDQTGKNYQMQSDFILAKAT